MDTFYKKSRKFLAHLAAVTTVLGTVGSSLLFGAPAALAGTGIGVSPNFPATVTVGDTNVAVSMDVQNTSSADVGSLTLDSIYLTPQCGDTSIPCGAPDTGVFSVSATATGSGACAANTFTTSVVDATTGRVQFIPNATIVLALGATCTINFSVNVLKVPTLDSTAAPGKQTDQVGQVNAHDTATGFLPASGNGADVTTVNPLSPSIATNLSATTTPVNTPVHDSSTLTGSTANAGGSVTYSVFAGNSCTGTTTFTSTKTVTNAVVPNSDNFTPTQAGTYNWQAVYSGDANNNAATSTCLTETLVVTQRTPTVTTQIQNTNNVDITNSTTTPGAMVHDVAMVTGSGPTPTGTVDFNIFNNSTCSGTSGNIQSGVALVNGTATSSPVAAQLGGLSFMVHYNGDSNYSPADGICEMLFVAAHPSTVVNIMSSATSTMASSTVTLTVTEQNDGDVPLTSPSVVVTSGSSTLYTLVSPPTSGDNGNGILDVGETWSWTVNNVAVNSTMTFVATGHGLDPSQTDITYPLDPQERASVTVTLINIQGCSPGYWKQSQHFGSYPTGIYPNTLFKDVFGVDAFPGKTLLQVLSQGGGGLTALGRIIVGAYLNAATISGYPYTTSQVIADFTSAYNSHNYDQVKSKYEALQDPCPLGNNPGPAGPTTTFVADTPNKKK